MLKRIKIVANSCSFLCWKIKFTMFSYYVVEEKKKKKGEEIFVVSKTVEELVLGDVYS